MQSNPKGQKQKQKRDEWAQYNLNVAEVIEQPGAAKNSYFLTRLSLIVQLLFSILNWLIMLRILFKMIAVNTNQEIAQKLYEFTEPFVAPFFGLLENPTLSEGINPALFEATSIIAIIVYMIVSRIAARVLKVLFARPQELTRMAQ